jgi:hypothetical protein
MAFASYLRMILEDEKRFSTKVGKHQGMIFNLLAFSTA